MTNCFPRKVMSSEVGSCRSKVGLKGGGGGSGGVVAAEGGWR